MSVSLEETIAKLGEARKRGILGFCGIKLSHISKLLRELQERRKADNEIPFGDSYSFTELDSIINAYEAHGGYYKEVVELLKELRKRRKQSEIVRRPVVGYEGYYEVDNCGRVYAIDRTIHVEDHGRIYDKSLKGGAMKQHVHSGGYKVVCLTRDGKTKILFVHRIVAMAFLPNPENLPCINHKDEDKTNNFVDNLEWCSYQYNNAYGSKPRKLSKCMTGRKQSNEQKLRRSESLKRYWANKKSERRANE